MRKSVLGAVGVSTVLATVGSSLAEEKRITDVVYESDGVTVLSAGLNLKIYVDSPRTDKEMAEAKIQMERASDNICDYTDGIFYIRSVEFTIDPSRKKSADIWWVRRDGVYVSSNPFGPVTDEDSCDPNVAKDGSGPGRTMMYSTYDAGVPGILVDGETLSHELGHLIFWMRDEYSQGDTPIPTGIGALGYSQVANPYTGKLVFRTMGGGDLTYQPAAIDDVGPLRFLSAGAPTGSTALPLYPVGVDGAPWWQTHLGVMQQTEMGVCRRADKRSPYDVEPILNDTTSCVRKEDCAHLVNIYASPTETLGSNYTECSIAQTSSEATVYENLILNDYMHALGDDAPIDKSPELRSRPARELVLQGLLVPSWYMGDKDLYVAPTLTPPSWSVAQGSAKDEFLCDKAGAEPSSCPMSALTDSRNDPSDMNVSCSGYMPVDTSNCKPAYKKGMLGLCGNGDIDGDSNLGEECDTKKDTTVPVIIPASLSGKVPGAGTDKLTCGNVFSFWRAKAGENWKDTMPSLKLSGDGEVRCRENCTLDLSRCTQPLGVPFGTISGSTTLKQLGDKSDKWLWTEFYDKKGEVLEPPGMNYGELKGEFGKAGPSSHAVFAFMKRTGRVRPDGVAAGDTDTGGHDVWEIRLFGEMRGESSRVSSESVNVVLSRRFSGVCVSPTTTEGTGITDITGDQGPTRWRRGVGPPVPADTKHKRQSRGVGTLCSGAPECKTSPVRAWR